MMKRLITAALAVLLLAAMPGAALAQEAPPDERASATQPGSAIEEDRASVRAEAEAGWVDTVKARALAAIEQRLTTLTQLETKIDESETVKANHAAALMQDIRYSVKGLEDLAVEIREATDAETLRVLVPQIFEDYRVYAIVVPKVHLTLAAAAAHTMADRLDEATESIAAILERLEEAGFDVAPAEELLAEMIRLVETAAAGAGSVPDTILGLSPDDYPASTATLRSAHETLKAAGSDLRHAGETAQKIGRFIKGLFDADED